MILILSTAKVTSELSFYSRFKLYLFMISILAFAFKIFRSIIFSAVKKVSFSQSQNFSTYKELFSRNFSTVRKLFYGQIFYKKVYLINKTFHKQWNFLQSMKFSTRKFKWSKKFSINKNVFHKNFFPWSRKFFTKTLHIQKNVLQAKIKKVF